MATIVLSRISFLQAMKKVTPVVRGAGGQIIRIAGDGSLIGSTSVTITGHDRVLSPTISVSHTVDATVDEAFEPFCLNAMQLVAFAEAITSPDIVIKVNKKASVTAGKSRVSLTLFEERQFPLLKTPHNLIATLDAQDARKLLSIVNVTDQSDTFTPVKSSVGFSFERDLIRTVGTDGNRCGEVWVNVVPEKQLQVMIFSSILSIIRESYWEGVLDIYWNDSALFFATSEFYLYCAPVQRDYPAELYGKIHEGLTDSFSHSVVVAPEGLKDKLRACAAMATSKNDYIPIKFMVANENLIISSAANESGEMVFTVPVKHQRGVDGAEFWVSSVYTQKAIDLLDFISGGEMEDIHLSLGAKTGWVFLTKPGLTARFAMARFNRS